MGKKFISFFLKLKHWKLFGLTIALPMISYLIAMKFTSDAVLYDYVMGTPFEEMFARFQLLNDIFSPVFLILTVGGYLFWIFSIVHVFIGQLPENIKMNLWYFRVCFLFVPIYFIKQNLLFSIPFYLFLLFYIIAIFSYFYVLYFTSKLLRTVELKRKINFTDYAGTYFSIMFFPIGMWIIQPKINKMIED